MPFYKDIGGTSSESKRTLHRLLALREGLNEIPERTLKENLLLATWNIRDFDKPSFENRMPEAIYYIAEIISRFDIVAIQEVYKDLSGLNRVMKILGGNWKYVFTDVTEGERGNDERLAFVYDRRKLRFSGLAAS